MIPLSGIEWWAAFFTGVATTLTVLAVALYWTRVCAVVLRWLDPPQAPHIELAKLRRNRGRDHTW